MRPRLEITEMFSTFAHFDNDSEGKWLTDSKLRRSIENCLEKSEKTAPDSFWALYWYKIWQAQSGNLAAMHLSAYLQESCYSAARHTLNRFASTQYRLADYFQMAIVKVNKILRNFDPERNSNLKAYAVMAFSSLLKDSLRQRKEADICTNYALLRKVSKKRLVAALQHRGLSPEQVARYQLAWNCFKALYICSQAGGNEKLPEPGLKLWQAIANLYNTERQSQLASSGAEVNAKTIEQWLTEASVCVRSYLYPPIRSLDAPKPGSESSVEFELPDLSSESLLTELINQEDLHTRQNQKAQIYDVLLAALKQLDKELQDMLRMYYKEELTQAAIAKKFDKPQAWVSRRLNKARELLLQELIKSIKSSQESQEELYIASSSNQLKYGNAALDEWLQVRTWPT